MSDPRLESAGASRRWVRTEAGLIVPTTAVSAISTAYRLPPTASNNRAERRRELREKRRAEKKFKGGV